MDDNDPIKNEENLFKKIFDKFSKKFKKKKKFNYEEIIQEARENAYKNYEAYSKFGISCEQASKNLQKMNQVFASCNKIMSPNQMREIIANNETILYADGEPYCKTKEGEYVWLIKEK